jgi:8-oxo-dGTP pyrophosphatase MutT (NUDIX family)
MRAPDERSAGGVVGRGGKVMLVQVENLKGEIVWTFPKGHLEKGETPLKAALREVEEETGWRCRNLGPLPKATYWFTRKGKKIFKRVDWYRMEPVEKTGKPDAAEILRARWFAAADAEKALSYPGDVRLLVNYFRRM